MVSSFVKHNILCNLALLENGVVGQAALCLALGRPAGGHSGRLERDEDEKSWFVTEEGSRRKQEALVFVKPAPQQTSLMIRELEPPEQQHRKRKQNPPAPATEIKQIFPILLHCLSPSVFS